MPDLSQKYSGEDLVREFSPKSSRDDNIPEEVRKEVPNEGTGKKDFRSSGD